MSVDADTPSLVTVQEVPHIRYEAMSPVWLVAPHTAALEEESPGIFRRHDICPFDGRMIPPSWPHVSAELDSWVSLVGASQSRVSAGERPTEVIAEVHNAFERVHPFLDGNGRTGRPLVNLLCVRMGYSPVVILKTMRPAYLKAMQKADDGDYGALGEIMARGMVDNLNRFILPRVAGPAQMVPWQALVDADLSPTAFRAAARRGRLGVYQALDGSWMSTRKAVTAYKKSRKTKRK